jgi:hypothetical protein
MAMGLTGAKLLSCVSVFIVDFSEHTLHTNPMAGCAVASLLALPALLLVPETLGAKIE